MYIIIVLYCENSEKEPHGIKLYSQSTCNGNDICIHISIVAVHLQVALCFRVSIKWEENISAIWCVWCRKCTCCLTISRGICKRCLNYPDAFHPCRTRSIGVAAVSRIIAHILSLILPSTAILSAVVFSHRRLSMSCGPSPLLCALCMPRVCSRIIKYVCPSQNKQTNNSSW